MAEIHCKVVVPPKSQIPRDSVVMTFSFGGNDNRNDLATFGKVCIGDFFDAQLGTIRLVNTYGANSHDWEATQLIWTDINDPKPVIPFKTETYMFVPPTTSGDNLPAEVALCASFHGTLGSGLNSARRRGRVYFGPLRVSAAASGANAASRPAAALRDRMRAGCSAMIGRGSADAFWGVWSRSTNNVVRITGGWVDDAWDNQRSRGVGYTQRGVFS